VVAFLDGIHALADGFDDAGALVAEHGRERVRRRAGDDVPVAVADAAGDKTHLDLAGAGLAELDVLHAHGLVERSQDRGAHEAILSR
jgi:hypothetical protein